jgi:cyclic peptide transporter
MVFIVAKRVFEYNLIHISKGIAFDLRVKLIRKIFKTSYQNFENIDKGRVYAALNDDVNTIGVAASIFTGLAISFVTIAGIFTYLLFIQFELTMILLAAVVLLAYIYQVVGKIADRYYEEARDERNVFSRLLDGMLNGFKEISVRLQGKKHYKKDLIHSADQYKNKIITANLKFLNAELLGESMVLLVLGIIAFGATKIVPNIDFFFLSSYIIVLLYLLSPIQALLDAIPSILQVRVAWRRINAFIADIPVENQLILEESKKMSSVTSIEAHGVTYEYKSEDANSEAFKIGPIDFRATSGEIVFVVGANGSGKSTLAKLLIGLYESKEGSISINEKELHPSEIGNYFSVVFNPSYLFKKLYNLSEESYDNKKIISLLNTLGLAVKIRIENNEYNTIELSSGQRKRLGLLQCYLEDAPIFLFDEWAADQDPHYRNFFYKTLLPELKSMGKIVIAITHDDNYFHVADRVMEMRNGTLNRYEFSELESQY